MRQTGGEENETGSKKMESRKGKESEYVVSSSFIYLPNNTTVCTFA